MTPILENRTLASLLKTMASIDLRCSGGLRPSYANEEKTNGSNYDTSCLIYEYFLGKFAMSEGQKDSVGRFDFVLANPPFNVSEIDKERLAGDPRYPFGIPRTDNGNHLWIQHFHSALNKKGRAGFVMANSAADARASEQEIRENRRKQYVN